MKSDVLNSPRLQEIKRKKRRLFWRKALVVLFGLLIFLVPVAYISRMDKLNIGGVVVEGNRVIETKEIQKIANEKMSGNYLWVFPKTNLFLYPKTDIKNTLAWNFKRLKDINLSVKDNKILVISVAERIPKYTWCGLAPNLGAELPSGSSAPKEQCYFVDDTGYIFDRAPYFSGEVYFKFYGVTLSNGEDPTGSYFFGANFNKLITFKDSLTLMGLKPVSAYVDDKNLKIALTQGSNQVSPQIILKSDADFGKMAENLQTAITTLPLQTDLKKKYSKLEYIDLRYGNKVFYKFGE